MMPTNISASIEAQIPRSLDDIITKNRDLASQYLATSEQISVLLKTIPHLGRSLIEKVIYDWRFVTLDIRHGAETVTFVRLLGNDDGKRGSCTLTSPIVGIDLGTGLVATRSGSIYQLSGPRGQGEPSVDQLLLVCADHHNVGYGQLLGVLYVFY